MPRKTDSRQQDNAINGILYRCIGQLLPVLFPSHGHLSAVAATELKTTIRKTIRRETDSLMLFKSESPLLLHVEVQMADDKDFTARNLLYYALIHQMHPNSEIVQYVIYTGQKPPVHIGMPLTRGKISYHYDVVYLAELSITDFNEVDDLLAYAFASATLKNEIDLDKFSGRFVKLFEKASLQLTRESLAVIESLVPKQLLKKFDDMIKKKSAPVSRIWDSIMKEGRAEGIEKGREQGMKEGIKEGIKEGMEKGQYLKAIVTAENCLKEGLSIAFTARVTQLGEEEVGAIAERLNKDL